MREPWSLDGGATTYMGATSAAEGLVAPGDQLGLALEMAAGEGCYIWGQHVHAAVAGVRQLDSSQQPPLMTVARLGAPTTSIVPAVGDHVTCKIVRINRREAQLEILCVASTALREPLGGLIRREDVRDYERDRVEIYKSFRPGDIVLGRVISLGDSRFYYVTTTDAHLGVCYARSAEGHTMEPVSFEEVECPVTKTREWRKVAKPAQQPTDDLPRDGE